MNKRYFYGHLAYWVRIVNWQCFHHEQVSGNIFERRTIKSCGVLSSHWCKVKGEKTISLLIARQLKEEELLTQFVFMHRNFVLLVDAIDWDVNYQDLINKVACDSSNKECTPPHFLLGGASIFFFFWGGGLLVKRRVTFLQGELQFSHKN